MEDWAMIISDTPPVWSEPRPHWEPHLMPIQNTDCFSSSKESKPDGSSDSDEWYIYKGVDQHILRISDPFNVMTLTKKQNQTWNSCFAQM